MAAPLAQKVPLAGPYIVLCEGGHDATFLAALSRRRAPKFSIDLPFFRTDGEQMRQIPGQSYSVAALGGMLADVVVQVRASPDEREKLRGIIVVRDCADDPGKAFRECQAWCRAANIAAPDAVGSWSAAMPDLPPVAVLLLPDPDRPGSLETLCLDGLRQKAPEVSRCIDDFLKCIPAHTPPRTLEKDHKAALICAVAALDRTEPGMTLSRLFTGSAPLIDVTTPVFDPFAQALATLLQTSPDQQRS